MNDIGSSSNTRIQPRPGSAGGGIYASPRGLSGNRSGSGNADPSPQPPGELETAFQRLRALLAFDGDSGPKDGVRARGYYLNILV